jgi:hypothetical protein
MQAQHKERIIEGTPKIDLRFNFQELAILQDAINKLNYIGNYTVTNSASAMSKSIGHQIDKLMRDQLDLEKKFEKLIIEKTHMIDLVDQDKINFIVAQIKDCADELKKSTNNICKSLAENPDIPKNLDKAKDDKNKIKLELEHLQEDLICGSFTMFPNILEQIRRENINIEEQRKNEMKLFERLRELNEDLAKEQAEYDDDNDKLSKKLDAAKKELARAKTEASILRRYRKSELDARESLKRSNMIEEEERFRALIEEKRKEKVLFISSRKQILIFSIMLRVI